MKYIYLDNNIVIDIKNERHQGVVDTARNLKRNGHRLIFSPAHVEEIANTVMHHKQTKESALEKVLFLKELTDSFCLLPFPRAGLPLVRNNGINTYKEDPVETYERVLTKHSRNVIAENHQKDKLLHGEHVEASGAINKVEANNSDVQATLDNYRKELHKIVHSHHMVMKRDSIYGQLVPKKRITAAMIRFGFIRSYFPIFEMVVEKLMEHLESQRYFPDKSEKHIASLHDTTHAIYAAYADVFVTNDANFARKVKAVYEWLGIETKVISRNEFVELKNT